MADTFPPTTDSLALAALAPATELAAWNQANPIGTWVIAYPGARGYRSLITQTRSAAIVTSSGHLAVWVKGHGGYIALTHVDPISAEKAGQLLEQKHQFLDLDADSSCPFEGASRYPYLTLGGQP
ncbi:hypothetical protein [Streptomyces erythrochromogenes]|uniref:hypothetical protein n=1 Tax=Streptomyces erythrochromogenes TaxID=285574 RepID=UPI00224E1171|nr:hypothetical protein [Streptomyces erythrochromogenes]MCX5584221.1 hypothetical protein [Streptomyces erythrochromogenes]